MAILRSQVEERLEFYDSGKAPKKNIDVMSAVAKEVRVRVFVSACTGLFRELVCVCV